MLKSRTDRDEKLVRDLDAKWRQWETAPDADWETAVEREPLIRTLAQEERLTEEQLQEAMPYRSAAVCSTSCFTAIDGALKPVIAPLEARAAARECGCSSRAYLSCRFQVAHRGPLRDPIEFPDARLQKLFSLGGKMTARPKGSGPARYLLANARLATATFRMGWQSSSEISRLLMRGMRIVLKNP